jgi:uncharacterized protein (DUF1778 family)
MKQERLFVRVSKKEKAALKKAAKGHGSLSAFLLLSARYVAELERQKI